MKISTVKKQVLLSIAGAFPCNAVLHKWCKVPSAACTLWHGDSAANLQRHRATSNVSV